MFSLTPILNIVFKYEKVKIKLIITDAIRLWNKLPTNITLAPTLAAAKKASKAFVKALRWLLDSSFSFIYSLMTRNRNIDVTLLIYKSNFLLKSK